MKNIFSALNAAQTLRYRTRFRKAGPFRHVVIENAFEPRLLLRLRRELQKEKLKSDKDEIYSAVFLDWYKARRPFVRQWFRLFLKEGIPLIGSATGIALSNLWMLMRFYRYEASGYLNPHTDHVGRRALTFVINLSDFKPKEGGRLLFLKRTKASGKVKVLKRIAHRFNSLVLFEVNSRSLHQMEAMRTSKKRLTLSGWFFKKNYDPGLLRDLKKLKKARARTTAQKP